MSFRAKATLGLAATFCIGTVWMVHANQEAEREVMYRGVVRDEVRVAKKKKEQAERLAELRASELRRERYEAVQKVTAIEDTGSQA